MPVRTRGYAHRIDILAPPAVVWGALVDAAQLSRWYGAAGTLKARQGGRFVATLEPAMEREALIDVFDPARRLRLVYLLPPGMPSFDGALVDDLLLEPAGNGTVVRWLGSGIPEGPPWDAYHQKLRVGTERALARLKVLLERKPATTATEE